MISTKTRAKIAAGIVTAAEHMAQTAEHVADKIDPPEYGVRIVWDEFYQSEGSYALGSDEEDAAAVADEAAKLESGEYIVVGVIVVSRRGHDSEVREEDPALWGIVTPATDAKDLDHWGDYSATVWDLSELSGYLRTVADDLISEARS